MGEIAAIILAAGKGTRMKSNLVKVMHPLEGRPMVSWAVEAARGAGVSKIVLVVGHHAERVREYFAASPEIACAVQEEQLGTGHAVSCALPALAGFNGRVLILCGDVPLVSSATLQALLEQHGEAKASVTVLTTHMADPHGYGRIVKDAAGHVRRIVEEKDATEAERLVTEINSGIYCVESDFLAAAIPNIGNDNAQNEFYLTDIIGQATELGLPSSSFPVSDPEEVMGINDRLQLATAAAIVRRRVNEELMLEGVTLVDPSNTYIEQGVRIGRDTIIHPNVHIRGATVIGSGCAIEPSVLIQGCQIGDRAQIKAGSVLCDSVIRNDVAIGPMAHLRPGSELCDHVKIGNFVETKKAVIGEGSKASHLTYLGDATIGRNVNVGCGTITCNYDGVHKHQTVIEDDVFVGSDVQLVAPVKIGRNSLIAAGTTVTKDVPPDSLAIARTPQVNKEGWRVKTRE